MVKCRDCRFCNWNYISSLQGQGLYRFSFCYRLIYDCRIVDPDVDRECEFYEVKDAEPEDA